MIGELRTSYLFTSEQLFGDLVTSGLSRHAVFLERAKAETGRDEVAVRVALSAYLVVRLVDTFLSADQSDAGEREGLLWQHNAVRRNAEELPSEAAETNHLVGIVDAISSDGGSNTTLRISLTAYAYFLEHDGRYAEALEVVALATRAYGSELQTIDFAACALFAARLNRLLARWDEATACYMAAERAAATIGDHVLRLRGKLGQGAVCRGQGNLPKARAAAEAVLEEATAGGLVEVQLIAYSDLSIVYSMQGNKVDALRADYQAFLLAPDAMERMRVLGDLGAGFLEIGAYDAARLAFEIVLRSDAGFWVRYNATLELIDLESTIGNRVAFERLRAQVETERDRMPPSMTADYLRKVGIGFARFGQIGRARDTLQAALAYTEAHRLNTWYFKVEAALRELDQSAPQPQEELPVKLDRAPAVQEMEAGLREYAALQTA